MKRHRNSARILALALGASQVTNAAIVAYEGFDYAVGSLTGQNGGTGFASGWANSTGTNQSGYVWDETTNTTFDNTTLNWDGVVNNDYPVSPTTGSRYLGASGSPTTSSDLNVHRTLSSSAGALAGGDGVLWMSAVYHLPNRSLGAGINIGLGSGYMFGRGRNFQTTTTDFIGVTGYTGNTATGWNYTVNSTVVDNSSGNNYVDFATSATGALPAATIDLIVVMKFTFGASDTVEAYAFSENDFLSEATFNTNRAIATYVAGIDENSLNVLSIAQGRFSNAVDEIRIGDTFNDVIAVPEPGAASLLGIALGGLLLRRRR